jgi:hypothetical protein
MLVEDATAFIEQLDVPKDDKRRDRHRRRVAQAELEVLEALRDVQVAAQAIFVWEAPRGDAREEGVPCENSRPQAACHRIAASMP